MKSVLLMLEGYKEAARFCQAFGRLGLVELSFADSETELRYLFGKPGVHFDMVVRSATIGDLFPQGHLRGLLRQLGFTGELLLPAITCSTDEVVRSALSLLQTT